MMADESRARLSACRAAHQVVYSPETYSDGCIFCSEGRPSYGPLKQKAYPSGARNATRIRISVPWVLAPNPRQG